MASINDLFGKASVDDDVAIATTVIAIRNPGATVLEAFDLSKFADDTPVFVVTYKKTTDPITDVVSITDLVSYKALVNTGANTLTNLTVAPGYVDGGNAEGDFMECIPTSYWVNSLIEGLLVSLAPDGTIKATRPKFITSIDDTNGNELIKLVATASAVNELTLANAATGTDPTFTASGGDANVGMNFVTKGTGKFKINGSLPWRYLDSAKHTAGTLTSTGATPTLMTDLAKEITVPAGATALKVTVDAPNIYLQSGAGVGHMGVYSGASLGALTTKHSDSQPNIPSGAAVPAQTVALILAPAAGQMFIAAGIYASASNAKVDTGSDSPATMIIEVC